MSLFEFAKSLWTWKLGWINHLWFLQALVVIYISFPIIKTSYDNNINNIYFFLIIAFFMTFGNVFLLNCANILDFIIHSSHYNRTFNFFNDFNAFRGIYGFSFVYFILGGLFIRHKEYFYEKKWVMISICSIFISMIALAAYGSLMTYNSDKIYDIVWNGYDTLPTLFITLSLFILSLRYKCKCKFLKLTNLIGINSLGIYFIHIIWGNLLIKYFKQLPYSNNIVTNLLFSIFILLMSLSSTLLLKKIPVVKKLFVI